MAPALRLLFTVASVAIACGPAATGPDVPAVDAATSASAPSSTDPPTTLPSSTLPSSTLPSSTMPSSTGPSWSAPTSTASVTPPAPTSTATAAQAVCRQDAARPTSGSAPATPGAQSEAAPEDDQATAVSGRIPPEMIQNPVRKHFHCFRRCYERALVTSPNLSGSVTVSFAIQRGTGKVVRATGSSTTIASEAVIACVVDEMRGVRFPAPDRGDVTVTYPIAFSPS